jgi:hypothetical protein
MITYPVSIAVFQSLTTFLIHDYNIFFPRLQHVLSAVTIFSICDYNPNWSSSSPMMDLLIEPPLHLDNTPLA